jgi:hypothetical protein
MKLNFMAAYTTAGIVAIGDEIETLYDNIMEFSDTDDILGVVKIEVEVPEPTTTIEDMNASYGAGVEKYFSEKGPRVE